VDGVKVWPLSREREIQLRRRMPKGVHVYNGDITDFPELIAGDDQGRSDAPASVFGPLAPIVAEGFLAWLSGHQDHFRMIWGEQPARSVPHLAKAYRLADGLGLFPDPRPAEHRMGLVLATAGVN
jgi:hypothetical protein